jgi:ribosomal protein S18 acetylase RimI-like enzyme
MGAFNATPKRNKEYKKYFTNLRKLYMHKYQILKALVEGINSITDQNKKEEIINIVENCTSKKEAAQLLKGLPYTKFPDNLEPDAGFFAILDFTELKGKNFRGEPIKTEKDLLQFFYKTNRLRFLIGQSISWPYPKELVGRITFALEDNELIEAISLINNSLQQLVTENSYHIRLNRLEDQEGMAKIKVDSWQQTYKNIIEQKYLDSLNYEEQSNRYIESFEEYKNSVLVAEDLNNHNIIGYACFSTEPNEYADSELVSLYLDPKHIKKGIGTSLFREVVKELKKYNKKTMVLWCIKENVNAINFYEKLGGIKAFDKMAKIGNKVYQEHGYLFYIDEIIK